MKVRDIALARSGDKGNRATLSVIAHRLEDYPLLTGTLTEERVRSQYAGTVSASTFTAPPTRTVSAFVTFCAPSSSSSE